MLKKILAIVILFINTCNMAYPEYFEPKTREEIPYKLLEIQIQRGDTLHKFAERYLNDPKRWPELLEYNKIPSGDPDLILPGDKLKVPIDLVKDEIADIFYLKNNVRMRRKEANEWKTAELYQRLFPEDGVRTAEKSYVKIKYLKGGQASISENSLVFLRPEAKRDDVVKLEVGELTARDVKVLTASAAIEPEKGSEYTTAVDKKQTTTLSVLKGKVDFISSGEVVTVIEGFMSMAEFNKPPTEPVRLPPAPKLNMEKIEGSLPGENTAETVSQKDETAAASGKKEEREKLKKTGVLGLDYIMEQIDMPSKTVQPQTAGKPAAKTGKNTPAADKHNTGKINAENDGALEKQQPGIKKTEAVKKGETKAGFKEIDMEEQSKSQSAEGDKSKIEHINKIHLQVAQDKDFTRIVMDEIVNRASKDSWKENLEDGEYWWRAAFINSLGLQGEYSEPVKFEIDTRAALVTIEYPRNGEKIIKKITTIKGKTEKDAVVMVNEKIVKVDEDGNFVTAVSLKYGPNIITIKAIDMQNRVTEEKITVEGVPYVEEKKQTTLIVVGIIASVLSMAAIMLAIIQ